jgi:Oxidoreductase family, C-terminal alpha/beta domain
MCSGVRSILGSLCRSADVQLWIDEEHAPRQRKVVKAFEQKLGGLDSNGEVAVVDRGQRKVTDPGKVGVVDLARWISGLDPVEVYATGTAIAEPRLADHGDVDTSVATLRLPSGALVQIDSTRRIGYGYDERIEVLGSSGMIEARRQRTGSVSRYQAGQIIDDGLHPGWFERVQPTYAAALDHFVRSLDQEGPISPRSVTV